MAQALASSLPGADPYYAQQRPEQQHLTLGRFGGTDAAGFAAWLSESLAGQNSLLPAFTGTHVQLSDEARPFPNHPIALSGSGAMGSGGLGGGTLIDMARLLAVIVNEYAILSQHYTDVWRAITTYASAEHAGCGWLLAHDWWRVELLQPCRHPQRRRE